MPKPYKKLETDVTKLKVPLKSEYHLI